MATETYSAVSEISNVSFIVTGTLPCPVHLKQTLMIMKPGS